MHSKSMQMPASRRAEALRASKRIRVLLTFVHVRFPAVACAKAKRPASRWYEGLVRPVTGWRAPSADSERALDVTRIRWHAGCLGAVLGLVGCVDVSIPEDFALFPSSEFVLSGTATVLDRDGPCLAWVGENGVTYHLFQATRLASEDFDRVTRPGAAARLVIATRTDLEVTCGDGTIVEVREVLEIIE